jgi:hypothetical protein
MDTGHTLSGRRAGRPKREDEPTGTITIRLPQSLLNRLDRHLDRLETRIGLKATRTEITRHALKLYLESQEETP